MQFHITRSDQHKIRGGGVGGHSEMPTADAWNGTIGTSGISKHAGFSKEATLHGTIS